MRFTVNRNLLCDTVTNLTRAVATKATFPVLEGILLKAEGNNLTCKAYNLEMGMTKEIEINSVEDGEVVINAKLLGDILRRLSGESVVIEINDRLVCKIKSGSAMFDIMGMNTEDFPEMPTIDDCERIVIPTETLKDMIRQTSFAAAAAEFQKPVLTGLLFECEPNSLSIIGVDGIKLAVRKEKINLGKTLQFVISAKTLNEIMKIPAEEDSNIEMFVGRRHIAITIGGYSIISRKIDGEFINYKKIIPQQFSTTVKIDTKEVCNIIERISLIINDQLKTPVRCKLEGDRIVFSCATAVGKAVENYDVEIDGDSFEIGLNARFLTEILRATESDEVIVNFNGPYASVIVQPVSGDDFIYMVMPIKLKAE